MPFDEAQQRDLDLNRVREHVDQLAGKFDTVHIFTTRYDVTTGETVAVNVGSGNWHARRGQVLDWILKQDENTRAEALEERGAE